MMVAAAAKDAEGTVGSTSSTVQQEQVTSDRQMLDSELVSWLQQLSVDQETISKVSIILVIYVTQCICVNVFAHIHQVSNGIIAKMNTLSCLPYWYSIIFCQFVEEEFTKHDVLELITREDLRRLNLK